MAFSADAGATWRWHDLPFDAGGALRIDIADEQTVLATARNGLYISRDGGASFAAVASGLPQGPVQDVAIAGDVFLVSMQARGLYLSPDKGKSWSRVEGSLADGFFPVVTTPRIPSTIFAASSTDGLFAVHLQPKGASASSTGEERR
jgi:photosystem II stability/assembly factor-like uncharacterized protein